MQRPRMMMALPRASSACGCRSFLSAVPSFSSSSSSSSSSSRLNSGRGRGLFSSPCAAGYHRSSVPLMNQRLQKRVSSMEAVRKRIQETREVKEKQKQQGELITDPLVLRAYKEVHAEDIEGREVNYDSFRSEAPKTAARATREKKEVSKRWEKEKKKRAEKANNYIDLSFLNSIRMKGSSSANKTPQANSGLGLTG
ncbi:hypothetical protein QOT17_008107 [Balamuthia mandrillaris]